MSLARLLNSLTLAIAFIFLIPASLILASWNSLPGDSLYSTKRTLERAALVILSPNYQAEANFSTKLISRRLEEANLTIDKKSSSQGLDELHAQLQQARDQIQQAPNAAAKLQATQKLVQTLHATNKKLETKKQTLIAVAPPQIVTQTIVRETVRTIYVTPKPTSPSLTTAKPIAIPTPVSQQTQAVNTESSTVIIANIETVQQQISNLISEVSSDTDTEQNQGESEEHGNSETKGNSQEHRQDNNNGNEDENEREN